MQKINPKSFLSRLRCDKEVVTHLVLLVLVFLFLLILLPSISALQPVTCEELSLSLLSLLVALSADVSSLYTSSLFHFHHGSDNPATHRL